MMKRSKLPAILFLLLLNTTAAWSQYVINAANKEFELFNYSKAIPLYREAYAKKPTLIAAERLAQSYTLIFNYAEAEDWYAKAVAMPGSSPENILHYGEALQQNSKFREAKSQYIKYQEIVKKPLVNIELLKTSCDSAMIWIQHPTAVKISNEQTLNSTRSDWGAATYNGGLVFSSDRQSVSPDGKIKKERPFLKFDTENLPSEEKYGWTGTSYLRLFYQKGTDSATLFPLDAGTNYHVGPATFTADGQEMFFTLTRIPDKNEKSKDKLETIRIEIYSSRLGQDGKWSNPVPFRYNNITQWSVGDPFINNDGTLLYFVSDMPGGLGGTDIYVSERAADGTWQEAINLKQMNTAGNERSPNFDEDDNLYFSSDGNAGMGGLDIFVSKRVGPKLTQPVNLGYPMNSPQDDFYFNMTGKNTGYFSSNRIGGKGSDDVYSFSELIPDKFTITGIVYNKAKGSVLANATVKLNGSDGSSLTAVTDASGRYNFTLAPGVDYKLEGILTTFRDDHRTATTKGLAGTVVLKQDLYLDPAPPASTITLNKIIVLEGIKYDFDKWNIRPDAAVELDKVVQTLKENPTIWIELGSHTDSRGNDDYNMKLSQKRAESAVAYIVSKGIASERITAKGYGESQLRNECGNGVKCTDEQHQQNRRTEIKITKQ